MNGAKAVIDCLRLMGADLCLTNPGTTELPFVEALAQEEGIRSVLTLFEGVATGAVDGYTRTSGKIAYALLHLGPGLANGAAFLHDARRARTPVVVLIGEHASWHLPYDPPLASDIEALASAVAVHCERISQASDIKVVVERSVDAAMSLGGPVVLIVPYDVQLAEVDEGCVSVGHSPRINSPRLVSSDAVDKVIEIIQGDDPVTFILGSPALMTITPQLTCEIASRYGKEVVVESFPAVMERGMGTPILNKLPYFPDAVLRSLPQSGHIVLVGARTPLSFFGYPGQPSLLVPTGVGVVELAPHPSDGTQEIEELARRLGVKVGEGEAFNGPRELPPISGGPLDAHTLSAALVHFQAEGDVVIDEGRTGAGPYFAWANAAPKHLHIGHTGGAIGEGMPLGVGAALARPEARVLVIQADGGGMYAPQSLWTMARENLDVKVVVVSNRAYKILQLEMQRGGMEVSQGSLALTDLQRPRIDWVALAKSMGVPGRMVQTQEDLVEALEECTAHRGPWLIEAQVS